jgi:hypothetical protein
MAQSGGPGQQTVTAGSGISVMPGGNLLNGRFLDTDPSGMSVRFSVPAGMSLDFGDGTAAVTTTGSGYVDHVYVGSGPHPWVFTASLVDPADNRWRGWARFEVPRPPYGPYDLRALSF